MHFIKSAKIYKTNKTYLKDLTQKYWFIPSDVLQRSIEANTWHLCSFKSPVLDIGIGNGELTGFLFGKRRIIDVGVDINESGLEQAMATKMYKKVRQENAEKLTFKNASFSSVVSNSTFEHIENDQKAVSEVSRVLKKNGLFFLTVPTNFFPEWVLEYEKNSKEKLKNFNTRANHLHYRSLDDWKLIFKKKGLEIIFYKFYFPKNTFITWYILVKIFIFKLRKRELWSILSDSLLTKFLPKKIIMLVLEKLVLRKSFENGFFTNSEQGAQIFIVARKV